MIITNYKNAEYKSSDNTIVDLEITTDTLGVIPISIDLTDNDQAPHILNIKEWLANNTGQIAAYTPPVEAIVVPERVTMRQARLALLQNGHLSTVTSMMSSLPESSQIEWEYASHVERSSALTQAMGSALSLSSSDLDDLFVLAATL